MLGEELVMRQGDPAGDAEAMGMGKGMPLKVGLS